MPANAGMNSINSRSWTTGAARDATDFYEFTIAALPGFAMDLRARLPKVAGT